MGGSQNQERKNQMRRSIFVGVVVACLVAVGTAVALAQQPDQGSSQLDEGLRPPNEMYSPMAENWDEMPMNGGTTSEWMSGHWDEMPMFGGSGVVGEDWQQFHDEMHSWMDENWDEMPMNGGTTGGWMSGNWDEMPMRGGGFSG